MQHKLGGLIISIEVNYISHYSKSPVHAILSTSFNSLPPVTVDFCTELLLHAPCPLQAPSSLPALCSILLFFPSAFLGDRVAVTKCFGGSSLGQAVPQGKGVGRAVLCPALGSGCEPHTACALCWSWADGRPGLCAYPFPCTSSLPLYIIISLVHHHFPRVHHPFPRVHHPFFCVCTSPHSVCTSPLFVCLSPLSLSVYITPFCVFITPFSVCVHHPFFCVCLSPHSLCVHHLFPCCILAPNQHRQIRVLSHLPSRVPC